MKKQISITIAQRIILRGRYAEAGETHVVSEGELAELQATYPSAMQVLDAAPQDLTERPFDPTPAGDAKAIEDTEEDGDQQPGESGRKDHPRRAGAKRPA